MNIFEEKDNYENMEMDKSLTDNVLCVILEEKNNIKTYYDLYRYFLNTIKDVELKNEKQSADTYKKELLPLLAVVKEQREFFCQILKDLKEKKKLINVIKNIFEL